MNAKQGARMNHDGIDEIAEANRLKSNVGSMKRNVAGSKGLRVFMNRRPQKWKLQLRIWNARKQRGKSR